MERIKNFFKDESGASAVEYGLLVSLIAVVDHRAVDALIRSTHPQSAKFLRTGESPSLTSAWLECNLSNVRLIRENRGRSRAAAHPGAGPSGSGLE